MAALVLIGGVLDAVENTALLWLLSAPAQYESNRLVSLVVEIGQFCSRAKFLPPLIAVAFCLLAVVRLSFAAKDTGAAPAHRRAEEQRAAATPAVARQEKDLRSARSQGDKAA
jgi:hypothetical protein